MRSNIEIVKDLYDLRAKLIDKKDIYENKLSALSSKIKEIDSEICEHSGHEYSDWISSSAYGNFRICKRCYNIEFKKIKVKLLEKK